MMMSRLELNARSQPLFGLSEVEGHAAWLCFDFAQHERGFVRLPELELPADGEVQLRILLDHGL